MNTSARIAILCVSLAALCGCDRLASCDRPITVKVEEPKSPPPQPSGAPSGRYQAFPIPKGSNNNLMDAVFVLDTRDGDLWEWSESASFGAYKGGVLVRYMGRLKPGETMGQVMLRSGF